MIARFFVSPAEPLYGETEPRFWYIVDRHTSQSVCVTSTKWNRAGRLLSYRTPAAAEKACARLNASGAGDRP